MIYSQVIILKNLECGFMMYYLFCFWSYFRMNMWEHYESSGLHIARAALHFWCESYITKFVNVSLKKIFWIINMHLWVNLLRQMLKSLASILSSTKISTQHSSTWKTFKKIVCIERSYESLWMQRYIWHLQAFTELGPVWEKSVTFTQKLSYMN